MELVELGSILHIEKGKKPLVQSKEPVDGYLPYVDIKAFEKGIIDNYATTDRSLLCEDGDLLIVCDGSRSGLTGRAIKGVVGSTLSKIYADGLTTDYLRYFIQSKYIALNTQKKGTGTPHLNVNILKGSKLVVPSIPEQQRVVSRIEELFSSLDKVVDTLQKTKEQLTLYRQAVLKEAFEGKLTNSTIIKNGIIGDYIEKPRYGTSKKCDYQSGERFKDVYRIPNIDAKLGVLNHTDIKRAEFYGKELEGLDLKIGDILIIRSNGSPSLVGTAAMVRESDINGTFAGYLMRLRIKEVDTLLPKFLLLFLSSFDARTYIERVSKSTSGVNNINAQEVSKIPIPVFGVTDQSTIVKEIESRISLCDQIEKIVNEAFVEAEAMRQSILKEAFEGGL